MSAANGYNPMRWVCDDRGCYNTKHRPKIEVFAECLPGRLAFTDVDATAEVNGRFLFLEFKSGLPRDVPTGQRIYFQRLTSLSPFITVVIICADAESMEARALAVVAKGRLWPWEVCTLDSLKARIARWAAIALKAAA